MLVYVIAKLSGFLFISIDFQTFQLKQTIGSIAFIALSFGFSFFAMAYDARLPIFQMIHSVTAEMIVNYGIFGSVWITCLFKLLNLSQSENFRTIILNFKWLGLKVSYWVQTLLEKKFK